MAFLLAIVLYVCSLDADVGFWDTAEMNTVPFILGLAHPTGFPSEILLGWLFSHVWIAGEVAFRLSLLNAIEVAAAAAVACATVLWEGCDDWFGVLAALAFASTLLVWQHATHTDVFSLCTLLVASTFFLLRRWWKTNGRLCLFLAALAAGLALGTHGAAALYLVTPVAFVIFRALRSRELLGASAIALGIGLVTCSLAYAYMPLRATFVVDHRLDPTLGLGLPPGRPFWDWGDPRTLGNLAEVVSGAQVAAPRALEAMTNPAAVLSSVAYAVGELGNALGFLLFAVVALLSLVCLLRDWRVTLILLSPAFVVTPFVAHFGAESDPLRYYIVPLWGIFVAAALGAEYALARLRLSSGATRTIVCAVMVALAAHNVIAGRSLFMQRSDRLGYVYIADVLAETSDDSVIVASWNYATPIAYAAYVQKRMGARVVVAGNASDVAPYLPKWLDRGRVYVVSEKAPSMPAFKTVYLRNFNVIPGSPRDPKLYELTSP